MHNNIQGAGRHSGGVLAIGAGPSGSTVSPVPADKGHGVVALHRRAFTTQRGCCARLLPVDHATPARTL